MVITAGGFGRLWRSFLSIGARLVGRLLKEAGFLEDETKERMMRYMVSLDKSRHLEASSPRCFMPFLGVSFSILNDQMLDECLEFGGVADWQRNL